MRYVQGYQQIDGRARRKISPSPVAAQGNWTAFSSPILMSSSGQVACAPSLGLGRPANVCVL